MPDFPNVNLQPVKHAVSSIGRGTIIGDYALCTNTTSGAAVWPTANKALFVQFGIDFHFLVKQIGVQVTTQSGNLDVGIYNSVGVRLVSKGTTAVAAAGLQALDVTDTWLPPGLYYMAMAVDNGTAAFQRFTVTTVESLRVLGVREMTSAFVLPDPVTFANPTTSAYVPMITLTGNATL